MNRDSTQRTLLLPIFLVPPSLFFSSYSCISTPSGISSYTLLLPTYKLMLSSIIQQVIKESSYIISLSPFSLHTLKSKVSCRVKVFLLMVLMIVAILILMILTISIYRILMIFFWKKKGEDHSRPVINLLPCIYVL